MSSGKVAAFVVSLLMLVPLAEARLVASADPARDVIVTDEGILVPIDSVDLTNVDLEMNGRGMKGVELTVVDLSRRGLEDRLFVYAEHSVRVYGHVVLFADGRALTFIAVQFDQSDEIVSGAFLASRTGGGLGQQELPVRFSFDAAEDRMAWKLREAVGGEELARFSYAILQGCEDMDTCQLASPGAAPIDVAPNEYVGPIVVLVPSVWWDEILPQDDGTVPKVAVPIVTV